MKDALKSLGAVLLFTSVCLTGGWAFGQLLGWIFAPQLNRISAPSVWYCIEGKIYEKISDTYVSVSPARTCLPVNKE